MTEKIITKSFERLLDKGKHRGFITYEELGKSLGKRNGTVENIDKALSSFGEDFIDMYFDNVGGEISDAVLNHISTFSRTAVCGQIANYNASSPPVGPRVARTLLTKQSLMQCFIVFNFEHKYPKAMSALSEWIKSVDIVYKEDIYKGFENMPKTFMKLFEGENFGKLTMFLKQYYKAK